MGLIATNRSCQLIKSGEYFSIREKRIVVPSKLVQSNNLGELIVRSQTVLSHAAQSFKPTVTQTDIRVGKMGGLAGLVTGQRG